MAVSTGTPLHIPFVFSFMRRGKGSGANSSDGPTKDDEAGVTSKTDSVHPYENSIKTITQVATVEEFWRTYDYLKRPNELPTTTDYHFFRSGIKPTWEDVSTPFNSETSKYLVNLHLRFHIPCHVRIFPVMFVVSPTIRRVGNGYSGCLKASPVDIGKKSYLL